MNAIGVSGSRNVIRRIQEADWKKPPRTIPRAVGYRAEDFSCLIFIDSNIAPHAIYQEHGVKPHVMRYLLNATSPIPLQIGRAKIFRWATERWMGIPHQFIDPHSGMVMTASGWQHPGYPGKYFFRQGIKDTMIEVTERLQGIVIRVARGES